jgi:DNA-binding CsgD family transcriptional regulator
MEIYAKSAANKRYRDFLVVRRFLKCNFSLYDDSIDIDERMKFRFEFVGCPLRGECKYDRIVCFPAFNSRLSERETTVMRMLYEGKTDAEVAEALFISINTVNNHRKNSFRKLEIHSMAEFMRYVQHTGLFNGKQ